MGDRAVPGHGQGELILGLGSSAIGTLVERTTRFTMLLQLPRMEGYPYGKSIKNGPARAGHGAEAVRDAIPRSLVRVPKQMRQWLTWDQGVERAQHARLRIDAGIQICFCDPQSPWQRGIYENPKDLLRQYFPKATDLSQHTADALRVHHRSYTTKDQATRDLFAYIQGFYNTTASTLPSAISAPQRKNVRQLNSSTFSGG